MAPSNPREFNAAVTESTPWGRLIACQAMLLEVGQAFSPVQFSYRLKITMGKKKTLPRVGANPAPSVRPKSEILEGLLEI